MVGIMIGKTGNLNVIDFLSNESLLASVAPKIIRLLTKVDVKNEKCCPLCVAGAWRYI